MEKGRLTTTRFAPSPTGDLHLGGALCALASWGVARGHEGGSLLLRVEDLDPPRVVPGSAERILADLEWLGIDWDIGPVFQSERSDRYAEALASLSKRGLVYPCDCSRAEIARVASAPHAGEETVYPGLCRDAPTERALKRSPALRARIPRGTTIAFDDGVRGHVTQCLDDVGDFVLARADGVFAYQLAVTVDDLDMAVTDVIRGDDLLASTPRQLWLARELGFEEASWPRYAHLPLVVDHDGQRLAKRTPGAHVRALRESGVPAEAIIGALAHALGVTDTNEPIALRDLDRSRFRAPWNARPLVLPAHPGDGARHFIVSDK